MTLDDIISNLQVSDFCYPLKSSIVSFINEVHFDIEKDVSEENETKMFTIITHFSRDLQKFYEFQEHLAGG